MNTFTETQKQALSTALPLLKRPRRNRKSYAIRNLVQETTLQARNLIAPLFITYADEPQAIPSMPDVYRLPIRHALQEIEQLWRLGIQAVDIFMVIPPEKKDSQGSEALREGGYLDTTIRSIKHNFPEICLMVDIALDPFTDHGHDGLVDHKGEILNDQTVMALAEMSLLAAAAGADIVAPSDMMDGRVHYIRRHLDKYGFENTGILSYAAKYASSFYGPFRDALNSAPKFGDKKTYQMNPANRREALLEAALDEEEGADLLLVKPALPYLDVLSQIREQTHLPVGAYHVSGEYAMVMAAAANGWIDADKVFMESLMSIKRAGADFILTYAAKRTAENLKKVK